MKLRNIILSAITSTLSVTSINAHATPANFTVTSDNAHFYTLVDDIMVPSDKAPLNTTVHYMERVSSHPEYYAIHYTNDRYPEYGYIHERDITPSNDLAKLIKNSKHCKMTLDNRASACLYISGISKHCDTRTYENAIGDCFTGISYLYKSSHPSTRANISCTNAINLTKRENKTPLHQRDLSQLATESDTHYGTAFFDYTSHVHGHTDATIESAQCKITYLIASPDKPLVASNTHTPE